MSSPFVQKIVMLSFFLFLLGFTGRLTWAIRTLVRGNNCDSVTSRNVGRCQQDKTAGTVTEYLDCLHKIRVYCNRPLELAIRRPFALIFKEDMRRPHRSRWNRNETKRKSNNEKNMRIERTGREKNIERNAQTASNVRAAKKLREMRRPHWARS